MGVSLDEPRHCDQTRSIDYFCMINCQVCANFSYRIVFNENIPGKRTNWFAHGKNSGIFYQNGRIMLNLTPRFALSCSKETMQQLAEISKSKNYLLHTHASENQEEVAYIRNRFGVGNVTFYHQLGMTGHNLCLAHCIWLDDEEVEILKETNTRVLHCPSANLKLASGIADIPRYLDQNILCSLGADGPPCNNNLNMFNEMRLAGLIQKPKYGATIMPAETLVEMATIRGAETMHLENQIGTLEVGKKADVILIDLNKVHSIPGKFS